MATQTALKDARAKWLGHLETVGKHERTVATYGRQLAVITGFFGEEKALTAIRAADVGRFLKSDALLKMPNGKDRAERTVAQIVRVLRMFLEWAKEQELIQAVPFPKAAMPKRQRKAAE